MKKWRFRNYNKQNKKLIYRRNNRIKHEEQLLNYKKKY
jgi:hypothetical protein